MPTQAERLKAIRRAVMPGGSLTIPERLERCRIALYADALNEGAYTTLIGDPPPVPEDSSNPPPPPFPPDPPSE
jgi:hypothetical protein